MSFLEESFYDHSDIYQHWVSHPFVPHCFSHSFLNSVPNLSFHMFHIHSSSCIPFHFIFLLVSLLTVSLRISLPPSSAMTHCLIFITAALTLPYNQSKNWLHLRLRRQWHLLEQVQAKHTLIVLVLPRWNCNLLPNVFISFLQSADEFIQINHCQSKTAIWFICRHISCKWMEAGAGHMLKSKDLLSTWLKINAGIKLYCVLWLFLFSTESLIFTLPHF